MIGRESFRKCFFVFLSLVILGIIAEIYFRYFYIQTDQFGITLSNVKWHKKYCNFNNENFRDNRDFDTLKTKGTFRIGVLGDSFVFGQGIKVEERFSNVLEKLIRDNYNIKCEVYNMGREGWSTYDELLYFITKGKLYKFDALVLSCLEVEDFATSLSITIGPEVCAPKIHRGQLFTRFLLENSYAFSFFYAQYLKVCYWYFANKGGRQNIEATILKDDNCERYFEYVNNIKKECEDNGGVFYIVLLSPIGWNENKKCKVVVEQFEARFRSYLDKHNMKYLFLSKYFSKYNYKHLIVNILDFHPNELANKIAAEQLLNLMKGQLEMFSQRAKKDEGEVF